MQQQRTYHPQYEEIQALRKQYQPSPELLTLREKRAAQSRQIIEWHEKGELPETATYDTPFGHEERLVVPTELDLVDAASSEDEYDDMQRWLHRHVRFQEDNVFFELERANPKTHEDYEHGTPYLSSFAMAMVMNPELTREDGQRDLEDWAEFLGSIKPLFYGHTPAEMWQSDLDGQLAEPLKYMQGRVGIKRKSGLFTTYTQIFIYVGDPRKHLGAWMV